MLAAAGAMLYEYPRLLRARQRKELWLFTLTTAFAVMLCVLQSLHVVLPNPLDWITAIYKPMSRVILSALG